VLKNSFCGLQSASRFQRSNLGKDSNPAAIDLLPDARRALLSALKRAGRATIPQLAETLAVSTEAVRQQLTALQRQGWVIGDCGPDDADARVPGRPPAEYCLAPLADDLFPKSYASLATLLFDELPDTESTLARLTDATVKAVRAMQASDSGDPPPDERGGRARGAIPGPRRPLRFSHLHGRPRVRGTAQGAVRTGAAEGRCAAASRRRQTPLTML